MKVITINMDKDNTKDINSFFQQNGDIIFINNIDESGYKNIKSKLPINNYCYYKVDDKNSTLIISKLMFAVVNNEETYLENGCELYLPGSSTNILLLDSKKGLNKEYKPAMKNNKLIVIYQEDGIKEYNYEDVITYSA